nr:integrase, catalytic region, zinc finger, CCHC-type, peptidase aspartic, catalytic [Tanacetum cinerariifolium]
MATMAENVIAPGSESRPPMLEKGMYDSWKTRIMLYIRGKENGEMLRNSVKNGPYKFKSEIIIEDTDGVINIRREQRLEDLKGDDKLLVLDDEQQDFLADSLKETDDCKELQLQAIANFKADHVDAYDSDCDDEATTNAIFMANLSPFGSLNDDTVVPRYDSDTLCDNYVPPPVQKNDMMLSVIEQLKSQVEKCNKENQESKSEIKSLTRTKLYSVTMFSKSNVIPKVVKKNDLSKSITSHLTANKIIEKCTIVLALGLLKIETEPINEYFKNNKALHYDYLRVTKEHVATVQELLEQAKALKTLDEHIGYASKFAARIQELLVYVSALGRVGSTNPSGSKPRSNTKYDRILQPSSRSKKNKVEAHHRKFMSSANKNNQVSDCNANVKNVSLSKNSDTIYLSCNESIMGYGDLQMRNILISRVYYVEGLGHNLFLVSYCMLHSKPLPYPYRYNKTPYELLRDRKPELKYLYIFSALCYPTNEFEDLGKLQSKVDIGIFIDEYFKNPSVASNPISDATLPLPDTTEESSSSFTSLDKDAPSPNTTVESFSSFTSLDKDAPSPSTSPDIEATIYPLNSTNVEPNEEVIEFESDNFTNPLAPPDTSSADSSSRIVDTSNMHTFQQPLIYTKRWTNDHPLVTIIGDPSKPVL